MRGIEVVPRLARAVQYRFIVNDRTKDEFAFRVTDYEGDDFMKLNTLRLPIERFKETNRSAVQIGTIGYYLMAQVDGNGRSTIESLRLQPTNLAEFALSAVRWAMNSPTLEEIDTYRATERLGLNLE